MVNITMKCNNGYVYLRKLNENFVKSSIIELPDIKEEATKARVISSDYNELREGDIVLVQNKFLLNARFKDVDLKVCKAVDILCKL